MPINRNALIRYTTIDRCLRNRYRKWTLEDLTEACSNALYEFEGIDKGISRRTIQLDIQNMRSEKMGYNAPIMVIDKKYYTYDDPEYSITQLPISSNDLHKLNEAIEILKQFQAFSHFKDMTGLIHKLENKVHTEQNQSKSIIHLEKNENLKGLEHLNGLYQSILKRIVIEVNYQSFKSKNSQSFIINPYLLKEFNNRWFLVGYNYRVKLIQTLALDRISSFKTMAHLKFYEKKDFDADQYYKDIIGVTVNEGLLPRQIRFWVSKPNAPYVVTKPFHSSQVIESENENGTIFSIKVIPNFELERMILGFGADIEVLSPPSLREKIAEIIHNADENYKEMGGSNKHHDRTDPL